MSIVIKGMDMPTSCSRCPCSNDASRFCRVVEEYIPMLGKPAFCPLVDVPDTNVGDMISRQAAIDALIEWYGCEPNDMDYFKEILAKKSPAHLTQNNRVNSNNALDTISRQAAIDSIAHATFNVIIGGRRGFQNYKEEFEKAFVGIRDKYVETLKALPSAQPERDIPMKPNETIDSSWGIRKKQAVCPKCDYCLGHVEFIGNPNGKKVTYCETCGQAIDWEGWEWEEE